MCEVCERGIVSGCVFTHVRKNKRVRLGKLSTPKDSKWFKTWCDSSWHVACCSVLLHHWLNENSKVLIGEVFANSPWRVVLWCDTTGQSCSPRVIMCKVVVVTTQNNRSQWVGRTLYTNNTLSLVGQLLSFQSDTLSRGVPVTQKTLWSEVRSEVNCHVVALLLVSEHNTKTEQLLSSC